MSKLIQVPVMGGLRKKVFIPDPATAATGTTLAGFANRTLTIQELKTLLGVGSPSPSLPGAGGGGSIIPGPGLGGGGPVVGAVPIYLTAPIPYGIMDDSGSDGDPGPPGTIGINGTTGGQGPPGPAIYLEAEAGLDAEPPIPGGPGPTGNPGATGPAGPPVHYLAEDGSDGDIGPPGAPGNPGAAGPGGPMGVPLFLFAEDGADGDHGPPGQAGTSGSSVSSYAILAPALLGGLTLWFASDLLMGAAGSTLVGPLPPRDPFRSIISGSNSATTLVGATPLNGLNILNFNGAFFTLSVPVQPASYTIFFVGTTPAAAASSSALGGPANCLNLRAVNVTGTTYRFECLKEAAVGGIPTNALTSGTRVQTNMTFNSGTNAVQWRVSQANDTSGTAAITPSAASTFLGRDAAGGTANFNGDFAELILYNRVLTLVEIQAVEAYLFAKWGV